MCQLRPVHQWSTESSRQSLSSEGTPATLLAEALVGSIVRPVRCRLGCLLSHGRRPALRPPLASAGLSGGCPLLSGADSAARRFVPSCRALSPEVLPQDE